MSGQPTGERRGCMNPGVISEAPASLKRALSTYSSGSAESQIPDYTYDELEFMKAMDVRRRTTGVDRIPSLLEAYRVACSLGWAKVEANAFDSLMERCRRLLDYRLVEKDKRKHRKPNMNPNNPRPV